MSQPVAMARTAGDAPAGARTLLQVRGLVKHFPVRGGLLNTVVGRVHAVNGVSLEIARGSTLGVVGESGCGKSTLGKMVIRLIEPTAGSIFFDGHDITRLGHAELLPFRRRMQIIFQDPYSSLNPRLTVNAMLKEAVLLHRVVPRGEVDAYLDSLMAKVGMRPEARRKYPHEFSGGQRQRIGIARALAVRPELLVADEPVSALDVSIQAQVLNLLLDLKQELGLTVLFVSHDLKVVEYFCDRVVVMYLGHVVEELATRDVHGRARHPYTKALLGANPIDDPDERRPLTVLRGDVPSPFNPPAGCAFAGRCPLVMDRCRTHRPALAPVGEGHWAACWAVEERKA